MLLFCTEMTNNLTERRKTGNLGEDLASRFLMKQGFNIIERNYLRKCGEIDIVAKNNGKLHFIEVKSVSCETMPDVSHETIAKDDFKPEDNIHSWKLERISKTIHLYLMEKSVSSETEWYFDVITVYIDKVRRISRINMLKNIVL